jgi:hypothetical protein
VRLSTCCAATSALIEPLQMHLDNSLWLLPTFPMGATS